MARVLTFAYPGDLNTLTGGYLYDKQIIEALRSQGWIVQCLSLDGEFPHPCQQDLHQAVERLAAVPANSYLIVDGLALGAMGDLTQRFAQRSQAQQANTGFIALVHHPLALEAGIPTDVAHRLEASEAAALKHAAHVIVTSNTTRRTVESMFGIAPTKITTVVPGTERSPGVLQVNTAPTKLTQSHNLATAPSTVLLSVGSVIARKGYDVLVQALSGLKHLDWTLRIVGDASRDVSTAERLNAQITQLGLTERITLLGNLAQSTLETQYSQADVFVLASRYEGYGMAYAEAMLWGLPIVGTTGGAIAETASADGSFLVEPDNVAQLQQALQRLLTDPALRVTMAQASWRDGQRLPSWRDSAQALAHAIHPSDR